jgi:hypothetical protein
MRECARERERQAHRRSLISEEYSACSGEASTVEKAVTFDTGHEAPALCLGERWYPQMAAGRSDQSVSADAISDDRPEQVQLSAKYLQVTIREP